MRIQTSCYLTLFLIDWGQADTRPLFTASVQRPKTGKLKLKWCVWRHCIVRTGYIILFQDYGVYFPYNLVWRQCDGLFSLRMQFNGIALAWFFFPLPLSIFVVLMLYIYFGVLTVTLLHHTNISSIIGYYTITACLEVFQSLLNQEEGRHGSSWWWFTAPGSRGQS